MKKAMPPENSPVDLQKKHQPPSGVSVCVCVCVCVCDTELVGMPKPKDQLQSHQVRRLPPCSVQSEPLKGTIKGCFLFCHTGPTQCLRETFPKLA